MLVFTVITLAGGGSSFASIDFDELSFPDFGVEQSALPATFESIESAVVHKRSQRLTESRVPSRPDPRIVRGVSQSNFYRYEHISERAPPLLL